MENENKWGMRLFLRAERPGYRVSKWAASGANTANTALQLWGRRPCRSGTAGLGSALRRPAAAPQSAAGKLCLQCCVAAAGGSGRLCGRRCGRKGRRGGKVVMQTVERPASSAASAPEQHRQYPPAARTRPPPRWQPWSAPAWWSLPLSRWCTPQWSWYGQGQVESGAGSGVIISSDGYIPTCAHVVEGASRSR